MDDWTVFHSLAESNRKEESDRIDLLAWLQERLPLAMMDHVTRVCRIFAYIMSLFLMPCV